MRGMHTIYRSRFDLSIRRNANKVIAFSRSNRYSTVLSSPKKTAENELKGASRWELCAAVCVIRLPLIAPDLTILEKKYLQLLDNLEDERSVLNDWEVEKQRQLDLIEAIQTGKKSADSLDFKVSHQDREDEYETKLQTFSPPETSNDDDGDMTSLRRLMQHHLTYIVNKKLGNDTIWMLPTVSIKDGETMRECAQRALYTHSGNKLHGKILSNAPSGYFKYKFPKEVRLKSTDDCVGAKVFIYTALLETREPTDESLHVMHAEENKDEILDHVWASKEELAKYLKPKYFEALQKIMI